MENKKIYIFLVLWMLCAGHAYPAERGGAPQSVLIHRALGCMATVLATMSDDNFSEFGIKKNEVRPGDNVWVRVKFYNESNPIFLHEQYGIVLYMRDGTHGALFMAYPDKERQGVFTSGGSLYKLDRKGTRWEASEGSGGGHDYLILGREVTKLSSTPRYRIKLRPGKCSDL